jgi:hypothetical protein
LQNKTVDIREEQKRQENQIEPPASFFPEEQLTEKVIDSHP